MLILNEIQILMIEILVVFEMNDWVRKWGMCLRKVNKLLGWRNSRGNHSNQCHDYTSFKRKNSWLTFDKRADKANSPQLIKIDGNFKCLKYG